MTEKAKWIRNKMNDRSKANLDNKSAMSIESECVFDNE
jgi:hypothetical protein